MAVRREVGAGMKVQYIMELDECLGDGCMLFYGYLGWSCGMAPDEEELHMRGLFVI